MAQREEYTCNAAVTEDMGLIPWVGKFPWIRAWQPTSVFLPGEFQGQRGLAGYSSWGLKELDTTEVTWHVCTQEFGINRYTLLHIRQINKSVSMGNYIPYLVLTYNGKEFEKEYICVYVCTHTHTYI